jgi:hypothetical protein
MLAIKENPVKRITAALALAMLSQNCAHTPAQSERTGHRGELLRAQQATADSFFVAVRELDTARVRSLSVDTKALSWLRALRENYPAFVASDMRPEFIGGGGLPTGDAPTGLLYHVTYGSFDGVCHRRPADDPLEIVLVTSERGWRVADVYFDVC